MFEHNFINGPVKCPYDENHQVARSRIQHHIVKCEKNYPPNYKIICPYDATHRLFKSEMAEHIVSCPKRFLIVRAPHTGITRHGCITPSQFSELASTVDFEESWDDKNENDFADTTQESLQHDDNLPNNRETASASGVIDKDKGEESFRPPRGYAEVMYVEADNTIVEDAQSVVSTMGMGRGINQINRKIGNFLGRGRGRSINDL